MENEHFDEFRKVEMKMFTLEQVKDNLRLVADGLFLSMVKYYHHQYHTIITRKKVFDLAPGA